MGKHYLVLGAGMQGTAAAYDLASFGDADRVILADQDYEVAKAAAIRVNDLNGNYRVIPHEVSAGDTRALSELMNNASFKIDACLSAVPYRFSPLIARVAISTHTHFNDLGGNTAIVEQVLSLNDDAKNVGVSLVPDCGVAPGMINIIAMHEIEAYENDADVRLFCGGLPQNKELPYGYKILFDPNGLTNEYSGKAKVIRKGVVKEVDTLSIIRQLELLDPAADNVISLEASPTSGGTSNCTTKLVGRVNSYEYMTLRYPGHFEALRAFKDFGFFDETRNEAYGSKSLRDIFHDRASAMWRFPNEPDVLYLNVSTRGTERATHEQSQKSFTLIDRQDPTTGFTAMERTTAFSAAIVTIMQAKGEIEPGANTPSFVVPCKDYMRQLQKRGFYWTRDFV